MTFFSFFLLFGFLEQSDATKFTVAGRLQTTKTPAKLPFTKPTDDKMNPPKTVFKSTNAPQLGLAKSPSMMVPVLPALTSPKRDSLVILKRSLSVPGEDDEIGDVVQLRNGSKVMIPKLDDDDTFGTFFQKIVPESVITEENVEVSDFDIIKPTEKLITKRVVQGPKGRRSARNPLKTLAAREDLQTEYTELKSSTNDKDTKRIKHDSVSSRNSHLAVEAIAALASVEDFKSVNLRSSSLPLNQSFLPYKSTMLLHIKGRTHIQTRLVEPRYTSINRGDCFILVTKDKLYRFVGALANVIEISRSKNISFNIIQNKDLGCNASKEHLLEEGKIGNESHKKEFWRLLGKPDDYELTDCGHADEDDLFESSLIDSNMIYEFKNDTLVPLDSYWGCIPKIEMLEPNKVLVFDFGSEVYVWNGKNAPSDDKRAALRLAQERFNNGYDYSSCVLNPVNFSVLSGNREITKVTKKGFMPDWCLLAKVNQNMETILLREKFFDWPEVERDDLEKDYLLNGGTMIRALNGAELYRGQPYEEPNYVLENANLGRGDFYFDMDTRRHFQIISNSTAKWQINENALDSINEASYNHFYSSESYIIRWKYQISVNVRELSGQVSKRNATVGRERCVYFCWQGNNSSVNEKGAAALLTVELDNEKGAQVRIAQGDEPTPFIRLFNGIMVHMGRREECDKRRSSWRMFIMIGNDINETVLQEVECKIENLRSRNATILIHGRKNLIYVWYGAKILSHTKKIAKELTQQLAENSTCSELFTIDKEVSFYEIDEGTEPTEFFDAIGSKNRQLYTSFVNQKGSMDFTPRLFHITSTQGKFSAAEIHSQLR